VTRFIAQPKTREPAFFISFFSDHIISAINFFIDNNNYNNQSFFILELELELQLELYFYLNTVNLYDKIIMRITIYFTLYKHDVKI